MHFFSLVREPVFTRRRGGAGQQEISELFQWLYSFNSLSEQGRPDPEGWKSIRNALNSDKEAVKITLRGKPVMLTKNDLVSLRGVDEKTLLHHVASQDNIIVTANIAGEQQQIDIAEDLAWLLFREGADVGAADDQGNTPLLLGGGKNVENLLGAYSEENEYENALVYLEQVKADVILLSTYLEGKRIAGLAAFPGVKSGNKSYEDLPEDIRAKIRTGFAVELYEVFTENLDVTKAKFDDGRIKSQFFRVFRKTFEKLNLGELETRNLTASEDLTKVKIILKKFIHERATDQLNVTIDMFDGGGEEDFVVDPYVKILGDNLKKQYGFSINNFRPRIIKEIRAKFIDYQNSLGDAGNNKILSFIVDGSLGEQRYLFHIDTAGIQHLYFQEKQNGPLIPKNDDQEVVGNILIESKRSFAWNKIKKMDPLLAAINLEIDVDGQNKAKLKMLFKLVFYNFNPGQAVATDREMDAAFEKFLEGDDEFYIQFAGNIRNEDRIPSFLELLENKIIGGGVQFYDQYQFPNLDLSNDNSFAPDDYLTNPQFDFPKQLLVRTSGGGHFFSCVIAREEGEYKILISDSVNDGKSIGNDENYRLVRNVIAEKLGISVATIPNQNVIVATNQVDAIQLAGMNMASSICRQAAYLGAQYVVQRLNRGSKAVDLAGQVNIFEAEILGEVEKFIGREPADDLIPAPGRVVVEEEKDAGGAAPSLAAATAVAVRDGAKIADATLRGQCDDFAGVENFIRYCQILQNPYQAEPDALEILGELQRLDAAKSAQINYELYDAATGVTENIQCNLAQIAILYHQPNLLSACIEHYGLECLQSFQQGGIIYDTENFLNSLASGKSINPDIITQNKTKILEVILANSEVLDPTVKNNLQKQYIELVLRQTWPEDRIKLGSTFQREPALFIGYDLHAGNLFKDYPGISQRITSDVNGVG